MNIHKITLPLGMGVAGSGSLFDFRYAKR